MDGSEEKDRKSYEGFSGGFCRDNGGGYGTNGGYHGDDGRNGGDLKVEDDLLEKLLKKANTHDYKQAP